MFYTSKSN